MKVYAIVAQRKQNYPGQYAPELLDAFDENTRYDDPDLFDEAIAEAKANMGDANGAISAYAVLKLTLDDTLIDQALNPTAAGHVVGEVLASTLTDGQTQP